MLRRRTPMPRWLALTVHLFLVGIGIVITLAGFARYNAGRAIAGGVTTTGTVSNVTTGQNCGRYGCSTYWVPTISFVPVDSSSSQTVSFVGPQGGEISTGQMVSVSYSPANPADAHDLSAGTGDGLVLELVGFAMMLLSVLWFVFGLQGFHRLTGWQAAHGGSGFVGHRHLHSVQITVVVVLVLAIVAILIVQPSI